MTEPERRRRINWDLVNLWGPIVLGAIGTILGVTALILKANGH